MKNLFQANLLRYDMQVVVCNSLKLILVNFVLNDQHHFLVLILDLKKIILQDILKTEKKNIRYMIN